MDHSNDSLPTSKSQITGAIILVVMVCLLVFYATYLIGSPPESSISLKITKSVLENVIAGLVSAVTLILIYRGSHKFIENTDRVIEIGPKQISARLIENARCTENYIFIGNTASFVASTILPILVSTARNERKERRVSLHLINPVDEISVQNYINYKDSIAARDSSLADAESLNWSVPKNTQKLEKSRVKGSILGAIYLAAYSSKQHGFFVHIYLRNYFTPFRVDISSKEAVLTQESRLEAAVGFSSSGHFYSWYRKESSALEPQAAITINFSLPDLIQVVKNLCAPIEGQDKVRQSVSSLIDSIPQLKKLLDDPAAIDIAVDYVLRPQNPYTR